MKKLVLGLLFLTGFIAKAQVYNNEWIDYSKTYYKFKVGKTGLYRIPQSVLSSAGLGSTPAEYFQLWRNGKQVPVYTSVATGILSSSDYIEFWGEMNDGRPDRELYRDPNWQLNDKWSLETDTAAYFLTVNTNVSGNLRLKTTANNISGTSLSVDQYFMYTTGKYFKDKINAGYAVNVGEYLYSSSYDKGEGWSSADIVSSFSGNTPTYGNNQLVFTNLNVYKAGPAPSPKFKIAVSGNLINQRRYLAKINSDSIIGNSVDFFNYVVDSSVFSVNTLNSVSDTVTVFNYTVCSFNNCPASDRMVVHQYEMTYPRTFNFSGQANFEFALAANASGNYLQITNFSYGSSTPVLYDLTNGKRYVADLSSAPTLKFVLDPSLVNRNLVLVSEDASNLNSISSLQTRNFINYTDASNQGDYLIISNPLLFVGGDGSNPVDEYRQYRSSAAGGSYNAKIYLADELVDQFGFGIKKNPAGIRNFLQYARDQFSVVPQHVFIIGHGVNYVSQRSYEAATDIDKINLVPTYGYPASDILLTANRGSSLPLMSIGRLSVVTPQEVSLYLKKIKDFEQAQTVQSPLIKEKGWMKNVVHIIGASDENLDNILSQDMKYYAGIISDTLFGAKVTTFNKATSDAISQVSSSALSNLFEEGISIITYFGHSSSTTLEFNLDDPQNYQNFGKYPLFIGMGCNAGNFFNYSSTRFITKETISEKYVLAPDRGTIGFIASTHFGIVHYLNIWAERAYANISYKNYGKSMGDIIKATAADVFNYTTQEDFYARCNTEQTEFHGDPALRLNPFPKPDYVITDSLVKMPKLVSVADQSFKLDATFLNIGKSPDSSIVLEVKRQLPDQSTVVVRRDTIQGINYSKSMIVDVPVTPDDKGINKVIVTVDADNNVDESFENNNSVTKEILVYESELRPIYPYNYAIVNRADIKLTASTANPFDTLTQYYMELDTTALFNSPFKISRTVSSKGGIVEFDPGITFNDHVVYYWRTSPPPTNGNEFKWNTSSFIYVANGSPGFNQSHFYQHTKSATQNMSLDSTTRKWNFGKITNNLFMRNGVFPTAASFAVDFSVAVNGDPYIRSVCGVSNIIVNVIDPLTFKPWANAHAGDPSQYGSDPVCGESRFYNFQYDILDTNKRRKLMEFLDLIPDNYYVVVKNTSGTDPNSNTYAADWKNDTTYLGAGNSIYNRLYNQGFTNIDSFDRPRSWIFVYQKNNQQDFTPQWVFSEGIYDKITLSVDCKTPDSVGSILSPVFGPARAWKELKWNGSTVDITQSDAPTIKLLGINKNGLADTLRNGIDLSQQIVDISSVDAKQYPYLRLYMRNMDSVNFTPYQLDFWQLTADPAPEGAVNPTQYFHIKDSVEVGEPLEFEIAFKNVSEFPFTDSMKVKAIITDQNNTSRIVPAWRQKVLAASPDSLHVRYSISTKQLAGNNSLYVEVNPDDDQPEQYHFNNFFYKNFYVRGDTINPLLDVTFDNVHILNHDIVSSKPNILIKLKDEAKWNLLNDPSNIKVQLRKFANGSEPGYLRDYKVDGDTLQFTAASKAPPSNNNAASALFKPQLEDGEYELIVNGMDMSQNSAGPMEYRVAFEVINKPMISNMLNYPNPFTTSTAFVFTLTGSEVPQNIRIQILTVTGKIVREITKAELGPLHIGRNITEFKWDGTDQYGQKLANGVYLYRVITNLNGKSLDKYTSKEDNTDKYFNKGYGKMYLMR
jgi:hypothetical protein